MDIHLEFREAVESDSDDMSYSKDIVLGLVNEIIRLKIEHEGLIDPDANKSFKESDAP